MDEVQLQLETLREIRGWGTWIVGIGGAVLGTSIAIATNVRKKYVIELKLILLLGCLSFLCAITLITSVPSAIEMLPISYAEGSQFMSFDLRGVFGFPVFGVIPMFYIFVILHASISIIGFIMLSILWRTIFE